MDDILDDVEILEFFEELGISEEIADLEGFEIRELLDEHGWE